MNRYFPLVSLLVVTLFLSCNKKDTDMQVMTSSKTANQNSAARMSGPNYSQPISTDLANSLITSYTNSVSNNSNALKSISFDATALRAYLGDRSLVTLKFFLAHQPSYMNTSFGKFAGMDASALTMLLVGLNENGDNPMQPLSNMTGTTAPVDLGQANNMIQSYLTSVNYPYVDANLRALSFDADTVRNYLADSRIVSLKFVIAHQPSYIQTSYGQYAAMSPDGLTMVIQGMDNSNHVIFNSSNGYYEDFSPCPHSCGISNADALLH